MVEGESGILAVSSPLARPIYEPSKRRLTRPNGAMLAPTLETRHRSGDRGGTPAAMLSTGNLNTAALTLFLALHLSVKPQLPWLILDDPVQSHGLNILGNPEVSHKRHSAKIQREVPAS